MYYEKKRSGDLGVDGKIILTWTSKKNIMMVCMSFNWLRTQSNDEIL
jgi:hypothetical protein